MMDDSIISGRSIRVKLNLTVWDFTLPVTPSLPAVFGISDTVIEDRFGVKQGSNEWFEALDKLFEWLLQFKISPSANGETACVFLPIHALGQLIIQNLISIILTHSW